MLDPIYFILFGVVAMITAMAGLGAVMLYMTALLKSAKNAQEGILHELHDGRLLAQHTNGSLLGAAATTAPAPIIIRITPSPDPDDTEPLLAIRSGHLAHAGGGSSSRPLSANQLPAQRAS